jgi:gliding-associated putative ABC transporter substrate-binding component GldG
MGGLLLILASVNVLGQRFFVRWDLTENGIYSLSAYTKNMMLDLRDRVTVKALFSEQMSAEMLDLPADVRSMLEEYKQYGGGNFNFTFADPARDNAAEAEAQAYGVEPTATIEREADRATQKLVHHSLIVYYRNRAYPIKTIQSSLNLEYELTSVIRKLTNENLPSVAFLQEHSEGDPYETMNILVRELEKSCFVERAAVRDGKLEPRSSDLLIVANPALPFPKRDLYELDQYIMRGGKVIFLVNRIRFDMPTTLDQPLKELYAMLRHYGVDCKEELIYRFGSEIAEPLPLSPDLYYLIFAAPAGGNHPILKGVSQMPMLLAIPLDYQSTLPEGVKAERLLETAQPYYSKPYRSKSGNEGYLFDPQRHTPEGMMETFNVGVMLTGRFGSFFADKPVPPPSDNAAEPVPAERAVITGENTSIIVIGCGDFMHDSVISALPSFAQNNLRFILNAVDYFTSGGELINIRGRDATPRTLKDVEPSTALAIKALNVAAIPFILMVFGFTRYLLRRRLKVKMVREQAGKKPPRIPLKVPGGAIIVLAVGWFSFLIFILPPFIFAGKAPDVKTTAKIKMFEPFSFEKVAAVELSKGKTVLRIERRGSGWVIPTLFDHPALTDKVEELVRMMRSLPAGEVRSTGAASLDSFGLSDEKARKAALLDASGKTIAAILVGATDWRSVSTGTPVRLPGSSEVRMVSEKITGIISTDASDWFPRELCNERILDMAAVEITQKGRPMIACARDEVGVWQMTLPSAGKPNPEALKGILEGITALVANRVIDRENYGKYGLDDPQAVVKAAILMPDGSVSNVIFQIGSEAKRGQTDESGTESIARYVRRLDRPYVYEVSSLFLDDILIDPETLAK